MGLVCQNTQSVGTEVRKHLGLSYYINLPLIVCQQEVNLLLRTILTDII